MKGKRAERYVYKPDFKVAFFNFSALYKNNTGLFFIFVEY